MKRLAVACCLLLIHSHAHAGNWPQFRGPNFNGSADETNLPVSWSAGENIVWSIDLPGPGAASPIVWDDHVFVSTTDREQNALCAIGVNRKTGQILWKQEVAKGTHKDTRSNFAAPTPATDGEVVIFFYGSGHLVAFDFDGNQIWKRNIQDDYGQFAFLWTFSSSPVIYDGKLFMQVLQRDTAVDGRGFTDRPNDSYLLALDPKTGKELWRSIRPSKARQESREAFTTPVPFEYGGRKELLVAGGDALSGHDLESGRELWRWGTWNPTRIGHWRLVPSPVAGGGVVLACAPKGDPIYAIKAGGQGTLSDDAIAWASRDAKEISSDVPTPAFAEGDFFVVGDGRRVLSRVDSQTGQAKWTVGLPGRGRSGKYEASPLVADGKVYVVDFSSRVSVFDAGSGQQLGDVQMEVRNPRDVVRASIVVAQGQLFVRTTDQLFCIAKQ